MSMATFDVDSYEFASISVSSGNVGSNQSAPFRRSNRESSESVSEFASGIADIPGLWAFDEQLESESFQKVRRRLLALEADLFNEFGTCLNASSKSCLLRLFVACPTVRVPIITCDPRGILTATWRKEREEVALRFAGGMLVHYAMVSKATPDAARPDRHWGNLSAPFIFLNDDVQARRIAH
jgi:hypothetical protein